jgi:hypothetical protein
MTTPDYFGISDSVRRLSAPAGYEAIHQDGFSWARTGASYEETSRIDAESWNQLVAQFRALLATPGVVFSDSDPRSPWLLRDVVLNYIGLKAAELLPGAVAAAAGTIAAEIESGGIPVFQTHSDALDDIAGATASAGAILVGNGSGWATTSIGTGAGTVAAGDDGRITGALQASLLTTRGDIVYRGASAPQRLAKGTAGQVLTMGADDPEWATLGSSASRAVATFAEYNAATANRVLGNESVWSDLAVLTDAATIAVDINAGYDFGGASSALLALAGNRTLGAPTNVRNGKKGILWFTASGSTRTLTLDAAWVLANGAETGPYSITTSQTLGVAYVCRGTNVVVTAIVRIG